MSEVSTLNELVQTWMEHIPNCSNVDGGSKENADESVSQTELKSHHHRQTWAIVKAGLFNGFHGSQNSGGLIIRCNISIINDMAMISAHVEDQPGNLP